MLLPTAMVHPEVGTAVQSKQEGPLRRERDGVVLSTAIGTPPTITTVPGNPQWVWRSSGQQPSATPAGHKIDTFYIPHPDDETPQHGVLIANNVRRGDRVIVVAKPTAARPAPFATSRRDCQPNERPRRNQRPTGSPRTG
jgi:hypothetical protein